jgi:sugar/nucleoside kinase (ribokinase family)
MRFDLLVVGEINADLILIGPDPVPVFGQVEKLVDSGLLTIGSSSVITACSAAHLGLRTAFIGVVGDDALGHFMLSAMEQWHIDVSGCITDPHLQTGVSVILEHSRGGHGRAILTAPGSIAALTTDQVTRSVLRGSRHLHCGSYFLQRGIQKGLGPLFAEAREAGLTCSLDTNWDPSGSWEGDLNTVLDACDLFFPNREEVLRISRRDTLWDALAGLSTHGLTVAAKLGEEGAMLWHGGQLLAARPPLVDVVDTTGAGDSFNAGYLYGYLAGWSPPRSLALAVAVGSLSTRAVGGTTAQPDLEEAAAVAEMVRVEEVFPSGQGMPIDAP